MFFFLKVALVFKLKKPEKGQSTKKESEASPSPTQVPGTAVGAAAFFVPFQVLEVKQWVAGAGKVLRKQVLQLLQARNQTEHGQAAVVLGGIWQ